MNLRTSPDPALIARLNDIVEPPAIGWWPLAPGWWLLAALLLLLAVRLVRFMNQHWRRNAYRREAHQELRRLAATDFCVPAEQVGVCLTLLRRCLLAVRPRTEVASLGGESWCRELIVRLPNGSTFQADARLWQLLHEGAYLPPAQITVDDATRLRAFTAHWVTAHRI